MRSYAVIQLDHEKSVTVDPNSNWKYKKYPLMSRNEAITLELIVVLPVFVSLINQLTRKFLLVISQVLNLKHQSIICNLGAPKSASINPQFNCFSQRKPKKRFLFGNLKLYLVYSIQFNLPPGT